MQRTSTFNVGLIIAMTVLSAPDLQGTPPLLETPSRTFHTGDQVVAGAYRPADLAVGDFNEDGYPDVVLAHSGNFIAPKFSVQFNQGDGTLGPPATFPTSEETGRVAVADLTGDGHLDVVFSEVDSPGVNHILIFHGNGDGTFGPEQSISVPRDSHRPAIADLDNDGDLDIVVPHESEGQLSVLTNDGLGFFSTEAILLTGAQPAAVALGDVDGDGWDDVAVSPANASGDVGILRNDGSGSFLPPVFYDPQTYGRQALALSDIDGDRQLDLVVSTSWLANSGDGTFGAATVLPVLPLYSYFDDVTVADLNHDGAPDFAGVRFYDYDDGWLLIESDGKGGYQAPRQFRSGEYAQGIVTADMDLDDDLEVLVVNHGSLTVTIHENDGGIVPMPELSMNGGWLAHDLEAADLDLDGDLDFVTGGSVITRHMNNGDGTFEAFDFNPILGQKYRYKLRDVNGDLYPDVLFIRHPNTPPYDFYWALNNGDGSFGIGQVAPINSCGTGDLDAVDFDLDGDLDVVISDHLGCPSQEGVKLILVENDGNGSFSLKSKVINFISAEPHRVIAGDFDQDGIGDIIGTISENVAFWRGNGDGTFADQVLSDIDPSASNERGPLFIVADDFNADGILDLATANGGWQFQGANITVLFGNGDGTFTANGLYYTMFSVWFSGVGGITSLDVDGDGDRDIACGANMGCDIGVLINDGAGIFTIGDRFGVNGQPVDVVAGDFDGDGLEDVAAQVTQHFDAGLTIVRGIANTEPSPDIDGDGQVNLVDLLIMLSEWGVCGPQCPTDLDGDGITGTNDLLILLANWS